MPWREADGWRIDAYLQVEAHNAGGGVQRLSPDRFTLLTSSGQWKVDPSDSDPASRAVSGHLGGPHGYRKLPLLKSQEIPAGSAMAGWLHFRAIHRFGRVEQSPKAREAARLSLVQALGALEPTLQYGDDEELQVISLARLTAAPRPLRHRPSPYTNGVRVVTLPGGLCGFQLAALTERLREAEFGRVGVLLLLNGPVDPIVSDWFPPTEAQVGPIKLGLGRPLLEGRHGLVPTAEPDDEPRSLELDDQWRPLTRLEAIRFVAPEPTATAQMMGTVGWSEARKWVEHDDVNVRAAACFLVDTKDPRAAEAMLRLMQNELDPMMAGLACLAFARSDGADLGDLREEFEAAVAKAADSPIEKVRIAALAAARDTDCAAAVLPAAHRQLSQDQFSSAVLDVIVQAKDRTAVPRLLELAADPYQKEVHAALRELVDASCLPALRAFAKQSIAGPRSVVLRYLVRYGTQDDGALLAERWEAERPDVNTGLVLDAMARLGGERAFSTISGLASADDGAISGLRINALDALGNSKDARAVPILERAAQDGYSSVSTRSLQQLRTAAAKAALQRLAEDDDPQIREDARHALAMP